MSKLEDRSTELHQYHQDLDRYKETIQLTFDVLRKTFEEGDIEKSVDRSSIQEPQIFKKALKEISFEANIEKTTRDHASQYLPQSKNRKEPLKPIIIKITVLILCIILSLFVVSWYFDLHALQR